MSAGMVNQQTKKTEQNAPLPATPETATSSVKAGLKGKPFDEQEQMLAPTDGASPPDAAPKAVAPAAESEAPTPNVDAAAPGVESADGVSEADQLRESIANRAKQKSGKEVMSKEKKAETVAKMANFTTCIEFARSTMSEGSAEMYKGDNAKAQATGAAMSDAKVAWETAQGERTKARNYAGYAAKIKLTVDEYKAKAEAARAQAQELRTRKEGESDGVFKQRSAQAVGLEANARAWEHVAAQQQKQVDNYLKMEAAATAKADELDKTNKAMIKAEPGLGARPKPGEFIILAQGPEGKMYGKPGSEQFLAAGSFKHIAVFMGLLKDDGEQETWQVTEGGGELAETNEIRIRKKDLMVFTKYNAANDLGSAQGSQLAGWIDAGEMIKARDKKYGTGKK